MRVDNFDRLPVPDQHRLGVAEPGKVEGLVPDEAAHGGGARLELPPLEGLVSVDEGVDEGLLDVGGVLVRPDDGLV